MFLSEISTKLQTNSTVTGNVSLKESVEQLASKIKAIEVSLIATYKKVKEKIIS
jgi:hypothetical protein